MRAPGTRAHARTAALTSHVVTLIVMAAVLAVAPLSSAQPTNCSAGIGVAGGADIMWLSEQDLNRELDVMAAAGINWVRVEADWSAVEDTRGVQNWEASDRVVNAAAARGMRVLGLVLATPPWARDAAAAGEKFALPADPTEFGRFAGDAAARYAGKIAAWEVWNEPNNPIFAKPRPDADAYASLISAASAQIRSRVPGTPIVTGGLAPASDGGGSIAPTTFIDRLYRVGDKSAWDAVGVHPYTYPALPDAAGTGHWNSFQRIELIRSTMVDNGDASKRVWLTEFGAPTGGPADVAVSEEGQGEQLREAVGRVRATPYLGPLFVYQIRDGGTDPNDPEDHFGLLRTDFSEKPAYGVVAELTRSC